MYSQYFGFREYLNFKLKINEFGVIPNSSFSLTANIQSISKYHFIFNIYLEFSHFSPYLLLLPQTYATFIFPRIIPVASQLTSLFLF